jgi:hypothetical protein
MSYGWHELIITGFILFVIVDCGANISKTEDGEITTPGWPGNYVARAQTCNWYIHSKPGKKILLRFETFMVEGDPSCEYIRSRRQKSNSTYIAREI